jgi:hypothetical protein
LTSSFLKQSTSQPLSGRDTAPVNVQLNIDGLYICSEKDYKQCIKSWNPDQNEYYDVLSNFKINSIVVPDQVSCEVYEYATCTIYQNTLNPSMAHNLTADFSPDVTKLWHGKIVGSIKCTEVPPSTPAPPLPPPNTDLDKTPGPPPNYVLPNSYHPWDCVLMPRYALDGAQRMAVP